ncbi:MAG TPA: alpha-amylase family glycosyl hydrolase [Candidatus Cloacimonadota bacterium]|nr:alpha-amylase family glycosyl hydrolase [Candidatus Cloacimonadota bacterium]
MLHNVLIRYQPPTAGEHEVSLAADFTDWQIVPLFYKDGIYEREFILPAGIYQYKLIVDGNWIPDPLADEVTPDPFGGFNSLLILTDEPETSSLQDLIYSAEPVFRQEDNFKTPDWVAEGVIYQIFPDRFCNGNKANDPDFSEWYYADCKTPPPKGTYLKPYQEYFHLVEDWYDISGLKQNPYAPKGVPDWWSFYGGDIAGVRKNLNYLLDLGVTIIYFNPLWQAKSNHKYDAADFKKIDPHFATEDEFKDFVRLCHENGIHIILDIALNHTGETFWAFRDCVEKGEKSPYWNWYDWKKWPLPSPLPEDFNPRDYYQCWWGVKDMPDLNYDLSRPHPDENAVKDINEAQPNWNMVNYILDAVSWWLTEMDIDGFRLDVPDEVPFWFWQLFREKVKSLKPDAWLVGELWTHAEQWVSPLYFDSVMNYAHFKDPVLDYFLRACISKDTFLQRLYLGLNAYPLSSLLVMMNLLGSHDTVRLAEIAQDKMPQLKLAVFFQMTYIGTPHIYYGDEIGMRGGKDPDNRRPFDWHWYNNLSSVELHDYYKNLIALRKSQPALQKGLIRFYNHPCLLIYKRYLDDESLLIIINNTADEQSWQLPPEIELSSLPPNVSNLRLNDNTISISSFSAAILYT